MTAPKTYSLLQISLHWAIAALIAVQLIFNDAIEQVFNAHMNGIATENTAGASVHVVLGSAVLVLAVLRLSVRLWRGTPPPHQDKPAVVTWLGHATHFALYALILGMPLSGLVAWFGASDVAAEVHEAARPVLLALIGLHVIGAFAEHFVFRNDGLMRMFTAPAD